MSSRATDEWRCPYCDGLNDWQDEICQICGDGRREEAEAAFSKASSSKEFSSRTASSYTDPVYTAPPHTKASDPYMKSAEKKLEEPKSSFTYTDTGSSYTAPSKTCEASKKKKSSWKILIILISTLCWR